MSDFDDLVAQMPAQAKAAHPASSEFDDLLAQIQGPKRGALPERPVPRTDPGTAKHPSLLFADRVPFAPSTAGLPPPEYQPKPEPQGTPALPPDYRQRVRDKAEAVIREAEHPTTITVPGIDLPSLAPRTLTGEQRASIYGQAGRDVNEEMGQGPQIEHGPVGQFVVGMAKAREGMLLPKLFGDVPVIGRTSPEQQAELSRHEPGVIGTITEGAAGFAEPALAGSLGGPAGLAGYGGAQAGVNAIHEGAGAGETAARTAAGAAEWLILGKALHLAGQIRTPATGLIERAGAEAIRRTAGGTIMAAPSAARGEDPTSSFIMGGLLTGKNAMEPEGRKAIADTIEQIVQRQKARKGGFEPEFKAFFSGGDPSVFGTTAERVAKWAKDNHLGYEPKAYEAKPKAELAGPVAEQAGVVQPKPAPGPTDIITGKPLNPPKAEAPLPERPAATELPPNEARYLAEGREELKAKPEVAAVIGTLLDAAEAEKDPAKRRGMFRQAQEEWRGIEEGPAGPGNAAPVAPGAEIPLPSAVRPGDGVIGRITAADVSQNAPRNEGAGLATGGAETALPATRGVPAPNAPAQAPAEQGAQPPQGAAVAEAKAPVAPGVAAPAQELQAPVAVTGAGKAAAGSGEGAKEVAPAPAGGAKAKEPHEMRLAEYRKTPRLDANHPAPGEPWGDSQEALSKSEQRHRLAVETADAEGKTIPDAVKAEYPDLFKLVDAKAEAGQPGAAPERIKQLATPEGKPISPLVQRVRGKVIARGGEEIGSASVGGESFKVRAVDGSEVRLFDTDFTEGGNPSRYEYIPKGELWIEKGADPKEQMANALHEAYEHSLMSAHPDWSYDKAHDAALAVEQEYRKSGKLPDGVRVDLSGKAGAPAPGEGAGKPRDLGSLAYIEAKKLPGGKYQLFFRGTRNEIFPGQQFESATEARDYWKAEKAKQEGAAKPKPETLLERRKREKAEKEAPLQVVKPKREFKKAAGVEDDEILNHVGDSRISYNPNDHSTGSEIAERLKELASAADKGPYLRTRPWFVKHTNSAHGDMEADGHHQELMSMGLMPKESTPADLVDHVFKQLAVTKSERTKHSPENLERMQREHEIQEQADHEERAAATKKHVHETLRAAVEAKRLAPETNIALRGALDVMDEAEDHYRIDLRDEKRYPDVRTEEGRRELAADLQISEKELEDDIAAGTKYEIAAELPRADHPSHPGAEPRQLIVHTGANPADLDALAARLRTDVDEIGRPGRQRVIATQPDAGEFPPRESPEPPKPEAEPGELVPNGPEQKAADLQGRIRDLARQNATLDKVRKAEGAPAKDAEAQWQQNIGEMKALAGQHKALNGKDGFEAAGIERPVNKIEFPSETQQKAVPQKGNLFAAPEGGGLFNKSAQEQAQPQSKGAQFPPELAQRLLALPHLDQTSPAGNTNISLRRDVLEAITGERPPASKAGAMAVREGLAKHFGIDTSGKAIIQIHNEVKGRLEEAAKLAPAAKPEAKPGESPHVRFRPSDDAPMTPEAAQRYIGSIEHSKLVSKEHADALREGVALLEKHGIQYRLAHANPKVYDVSTPEAREQTAKQTGLSIKELEDAHARGEQPVGVGLADSSIWDHGRQGRHRITVVWNAPPSVVLHEFAHALHAAGRFRAFGEDKLGTTEAEDFANRIADQWGKQGRASIEAQLKAPGEYRPASETVAALPPLERVKALSRIRDLAEKITGSRENIQAVHQIFDELGQEKSGAHDPTTGAIYIAEKYLNDPLTAPHELFHKVEGMLLTDAERETVRKLLPDAEARAEGFAKYAADAKWGEAHKAWPIRAKLVMQQLWQRIKNLFGPAHTMKTIEDFYDKTLAGEYAKRAPHEGVGGKQYGNAPLAAQWYSKMRRVFEDKMPGRGPGKLMANMVDAWQRKGEFKAEELADSGLKDWLAKQDGPVTKQQVMEYLDQHAVQIKEVTKGGAGTGVAVRDRRDRADATADRVQHEAARALRDAIPGSDYRSTLDQVRQIFDGAEPSKEVAGALGDERLTALRSAAEEYNAANMAVSEVPTDQEVKYNTSTLTIPGGENYKELLLTLPSTKRPLTPEERKEMTGLGLRGRLTKAQEARYQELNRIEMAPRTDFTSSHWDEPNVLAHIRLNDRRGPNGEKILHLEEIQSDWGQKLRKSLPLRQTSKPENVREQAANFFGREVATGLPLRQMDGGVLALLHNDKVVRQVVSLLPVDVVDNLGGQERATKQLLGDPAMIFQSLPADARAPVARGILDAARAVFTGVRAKLLTGLAAGRNVDVLPATRASDLTAREVVSALAPHSLYHLDLPEQPVGGVVAGGRAKQPTALRNLAVGDTKALPATDTEFLNTPIHTAARTEARGGETANFARERPTARIAEALDWHNKLLSETGTSQPVLYHPSDVPSMPFARSWEKLSLRRMIRYAAENGYDRLTWTTGDAQNERYDLSKQIQAVEVGRNPDKTWSLAIEDRGGNLIGGQPHLQSVADAELPNIVGKDLAAKILTESGKPVQGGYRRYEGLDLKVTSPAMKSFYDRELVNTANDIGKKFGAKVGETSIDTSAQSGVVAQASRNGWGIYDRDAREYIADGLTENEAQSKASAMNTKRDTRTVHSLPITPELRAEVLGKGQPLYRPAHEDFGPDTEKKEEKPAPKGVIERATERVRDIHDMASLTPVPNLTRAGAQPEAVQHAAARVAVPHMVRDFLSRVFPGSYNDPERTKAERIEAQIAAGKNVKPDDATFASDYAKRDPMRRTMDILNKDNILGGYDHLTEDLEEKESDLNAVNDKDSAMDDLKGLLEDLADRVNDRDPEAMKEARDVKKRMKWLETADPEEVQKQHDEMAEMVKNVEEAHDLDAMDKEVKAAKGDAEIAGNAGRWRTEVNPEMDKLYNEMKRIDPETPQETRGRHFGARVNLLPENKVPQLKQWYDGEKPLPETSISSYRNPNVKRDPFARRAMLTGNYSTDAELGLLNSFGGRYNEVTKLRMLDKLVAQGHAIELSPGAEEPANIHGEEGVRLPVKVAGAERTYFVTRDVAKEVRQVLGTDMPAVRAPMTRFLIGVQLAQFADMTSHLKNIHSVIVNSLGREGASKDVLARLPVLSTAQSAAELVGVSREVAADSPEIRHEVAEMAKQGLIRPEYPLTGIQKITRGQKIIHDVDTAARVIMNRRYSELVDRMGAKDTPEGRRAFVQQIGEYNARLMGRLDRMWRDTGLSPFIVAGRTFNRYSRRLIAGSPGFQTDTKADAFRARALQLSTLVAAVVIPATVNYLTTGKIGGRPGTRVGEIDTGLDDKEGRARHVDILHLIGLRRGLRSLGLDAMLEGTRVGKPLNESAGDAISGAVTTALHPWVGPAVGGAVQALTGRRLDLRAGPSPTPVRNVGGAMQYAENARVALKDQNPLLYGALLGWQDESADSWAQSFLKGVSSPVRAIGYNARFSPAEEMSRRYSAAEAPVGGTRPDTLRERQVQRKARELLKAGKGDEADKVMEDGKLRPHQIANVKRDYEKSGLERHLPSNMGEAATVWRMMTPKEQDKTRSPMTRKVTRYLEDHPDEAAGYQDLPQGRRRPPRPPQPPQPPEPPRPEE